MDNEWITPREAEQIVATAFGSSALISGEARQHIVRWITDGRLRVKAIEASILKPSQDGRNLVREMLKDVELNEDVWMAAAAAGRDLSAVWATSEISFPLNGSRLPDARATYSGVRFFRRDVEDRLVLANGHRGTMEARIAGAETTPELPAWLNPFQLVAWVRYRDACIAREADTQTNLATKTFFPMGDIVGSAEEALEALQAGQLRSYGAEPHGKMTKIEAVEWTRIALAPLDPSRQHPYEEIRFKREDVVASFPPLGFEDGESVTTQEQDGWEYGQSANEGATSTGTFDGQFPSNLQPVAPPVHGSERQLNRLDGIAVPDAIRLNDAVFDLSEGIREGPELSNAETEIALRFYATDTDALREFQVREIAMYYVKEAIQSGKLVLYTMLANGPHAIDRHALRELTFKTLRSGTYQPTNRLGDRLVDTALWIKEADWTAFKRDILTNRYGKDALPIASERATIPARKKPGPAPDPDWPDAIKKVTAECIAAGYSRPLKRGDKAAIQNLLLLAMAAKDKHPSDDTARKYAGWVIAELPDNSG